MSMHESVAALLAFLALLELLLVPLLLPQLVSGLIGVDQLIFRHRQPLRNRPLASHETHWRSVAEHGCDSALWAFLQIELLDEGHNVVRVEEGVDVPVNKRMGHRGQAHHRHKRRVREEHEGHLRSSGAGDEAYPDGRRVECSDPAALLLRQTEAGECAQVCWWGALWDGQIGGLRTQDDRRLVASQIRTGEPGELLPQGCPEDAGGNDVVVVVIERGHQVDEEVRHDGPVDELHLDLGVIRDGQALDNRADQIDLKSPHSTVRQAISERGIVKVRPHPQHALVKHSCKRPCGISWVRQSCRALSLGEAGCGDGRQALAGVAGEEALPYGGPAAIALQVGNRGREGVLKLLVALIGDVYRCRGAALLLLLLLSFCCWRCGGGLEEGVLDLEGT
mmetsp:Transcript_19426/g.55717  ORF Transcript_19426/g.55717 Transcript_19426/m.55717 type:complete len:393 (+) Transcript_19426:1310-2488(+)